MANPVRYFDSTMVGAPVLTGIVGSLNDLLNAVLVNGFGGGAVSALTVSSNVATVTCAGHGYEMTGGVQGPVIQIAGATPSNLNGDWRLASVVSSSQFTLTMSGVSDGTASGSITTKRSPLGWTRPFSGTNKAVYLPQAPYEQLYLRVLDDATVPTSAAGRWGKIRGYETMSDVDTGVNLVPTVAQSTNGLSVLKSSTSDSVPRAWWLVGDGGIFYFGTFWWAAVPTQASVYIFGDTGSLRSGDVFSGFICADALDTLPSNAGASNTTKDLGANTATQGGKFYARPYLQVGSSVAAGMIGDNGISTIIGGGGLSYPHPVDNGLLFAPVGVCESNYIRCRALPGFYQPLHNLPFVHLDLVTTVPDLPGRTLRAYNMATAALAAQCLMDITGPWR